MGTLVCFLFAHPGFATLAISLAMIGVASGARAGVGGRRTTTASAPPDPARVLAAAQSVPGVDGVRDLQIWTLAPGVHGFTTHVTVAPGLAWQEILLDLHSVARASLHDNHRGAH